MVGNVFVEVLFCLQRLQEVAYQFSIGKASAHQVLHSICWQDYDGCFLEFKRNNTGLCQKVESVTARYYSEVILKNKIQRKIEIVAPQVSPEKIAFFCMTVAPLIVPHLQ